MTDRTDGDGLRLVPIEPTPDMRIAGGIAWSEALKDAGTYVDCADACYKAMIRTAPQAPDTGEGISLLFRDVPPVTTCETCKGATHEGKPCPTCKHITAPPKPAPDASRLGQELTASFKEAIVRAQQPAPDALREAMQEADLCFDNGLAEGWIDALENGDMERIRDIWYRRMSYGLSAVRSYLVDTASAPVQSGGGTGPDFETAARALGFCQIPSGTWYHPNQDICFTDRFKTAEEIFDHYFGGQRSYVEKASHPVRGDRKAIARIIEPDAFLPQTSHHNCIYRMMTLPQAQEFALSKADAILSLRSTGDQPQVKPDREALIHTICPHIRQYSDSHWQGNHACLQCPATVKTPQGDAVQRCRRDAEGAADDVIRCWQSTGGQPTPQVSASALARMTEALEFIRDGYANQDVNHVDYRVKVYQVALDALGDAAADRTPAVVLQERSTPNKGD